MPPPYGSAPRILDEMLVVLAKRFTIRDCRSDKEKSFHVVASR